MSLFTRAIAPALVILVSIGSLAAANASALQRIAASIDVSRLASADAAGTDVASLAGDLSLAIPVRTEIAPTVELLGFSTEISVGVPKEMDIDIEVADAAGNLVNSARIHMPAGWQKLGFSGHDARGNLLPNGIYFYRVLFEDDVMTTRVVINR